MTVQVNLNPIWSALRCSRFLLPSNTYYKLAVIKFYSGETKNVEPSKKMTQSLKVKFPLAKQINVVDISGGCGSMYEIYVESEEFKGLSIVKQHRLINEALKEDIKQMHGLRIQTKIPDENQ